MAWRRYTGDRFAVVMMAPDRECLHLAAEPEVQAKFHSWSRRFETAVKPLFQYWGRDGANLILVRISPDRSVQEVKYLAKLECYFTRWEDFVDHVRHMKPELFAELDGIFVLP
jgi:hypothetical protein